VDYKPRLVKHREGKMKTWKYKHREPTEEEWTSAKQYVKEGWLQVSRRYRTVARLPEGMNGNEALLWALQEYDKSDLGLGTGVPEQRIKWATEILSERSAASQFMRCYTDYPFAQHLSKELGVFEFQAFRMSGGVSA